MPSLPRHSLQPVATWLSIVAFGMPGPGKVPYPITIRHTRGTTVIAQKAERVATVAWTNHEVPPPFGIAPVGFAAKAAAATEPSATSSE